MSLDNLRAWAEFVNDASGGSWLIALVVVALIAAGAGVWAAVLWCNRLPTRQRPHRSVGCQRYDPTDDQPDQVERIIADAIRYEADQQMLRRAGAPDIYDVFPEEEG